MKTIASAFVVLSVLAGIASAPASANSGKTVFDTQARQAY